MTLAYTPTSLAEALTNLAENASARPIAGCTDLMVVDTATGRRHDAVVDVMRLPELQGIFLDDGVIDIGAACTFAEIGREPLVVERLPVLAEVAAVIGGWQIQNRATIGGNIANASPAGDSLPVLLALEAELELAGQAGSRRLAYEVMHVAYRETALRPGELIVRVRVSLPDAGTRQLLRKVGTREAQAISKVVVACAARCEDGNIVHIRLAAGSVAPTPIRLVDVEAACEGQAPGTALADHASEVARASVRPIDDVRSTARYRAHALGRVVRRMVLGLEVPARESSRLR